MKRNFLMEPRKWVALLTTVHFALLLLARPAFSTTVILDWDASTDADLAGYKVYYQANSPSIPFQGGGAAEGSAPIDAATALTATVTGLDPANSYFFAVTAYNSQGTESVYSNIIEIPEALAPTVVISSPSMDASVTGMVPVTVDAIDNKWVNNVQFYVNDVLAATDTEAPYKFDWDTSSLAGGRYVIVAKALDAAGNVGQSQVAVVVSGDTLAPAVSFSEPGNNASVNGMVNITATADDNVAVSKIEILDNGALIFASNQNPATFAWNSAAEPNGNHLLYAKAYDHAGNVGEALVVVTVVNDGDAPSIALTAPLPGGTVRGHLNVAANAIDDLGMGRVEFYVDGALQNTATGTPYTFLWDSATVANGQHIISAKAYDAAGNMGQTEDVAIHVLNDSTAPTISSFSMPATTNSTTIQVANFSAMDDVGVTGYLITETATVPSPYAEGWSAYAPTSFTFSGTGSRTAYAWAKDAAGHVSAAAAVTVVIDTMLPVISTMTLQNASTHVTINASATDNTAVTKMQLYVDGYLEAEISGSSISYDWVPTSKRSQKLSLYVFDAAGNVRTRTLNALKY